MISPSVLSTGAATHVGRVREHNEDSAMVGGTVFVVADGMGGHAAGEVASRIAADSMLELADRSELGADDIVRQLKLANDRILASAMEHPEQVGMGTTAAGLAVMSVGGSDHWLVFNVGDSRVYRHFDGALTQVTVDHSEVQELLDAGAITEADVPSHPLRNVITRSLGTEPMGVPDVWLFPSQPGEHFLVCSDGLSNELSAEQILDIFQANITAQGIAAALVRAAIAAGGHDNVTAIVVGLEPGDIDARIDEDSAPGSHQSGAQR